MKEKRKEVREEYKEKRFELRIKYRKLVNKKLGDRINKISNTKLEKIIVRIDKRLLSIEKNVKISDEKKETLYALIGALKDVINEKLNADSADSVIEDLLQ